MASNKAAAGNVAVTGPALLPGVRTGGPGSVSARFPAPVRTDHRFSERDGTRLLPIIACLGCNCTYFSRGKGICQEAVSVPGREGSSAMERQLPSCQEPQG